MSRATPPFFLVGQPRSGTKMLRELLNASPDVWISDVETGFIPHVTRRIGTYGDLGDRRAFDRLAADLEATRAFWYWRRRGVAVDHDAWWAACPTRDWPGVLVGLFRVVHDAEMGPDAPPWGQVLWGDKTPRYLTEVPLLGSLFPASRFVHIVRDPRDCALSAAQAWGNAPLRTASRWAAQVAVCRRDGVALGPARFLEVRYEDLVADVRGVLARLFGFLGVPTPPDAGRFLRVPENLGAGRGHAEVVRTNRQKWKTAMQPALRRRIEALTGPLLDAYGYEREHPDVPIRPLGAWTMRALVVRDAVAQLRFRRRELGSWTAAAWFLLRRRDPT